MGPAPKDITGMRFGRLVALELVRTEQKGKYSYRYWRCQCDCGKERITAQRYLLDGGSKSCGCIIGQHKRTHGGTGTTEFRIWDSMRRRCGDPTHPSYPGYGGRGIAVCDRWQQDFAAFRHDMGPRPSLDYQIERQDNDGNYEPSNCVWATRVEQSNNRRSSRHLTLNGETLTMAQWERRLGMKPGSLCRRLSNGWTVEAALTTQTQQYGMLTSEQVHECRTSGLSDAHLGRKWRIHSHSVRQARRGETFKDHPTPPDLRQRFPGGRYTSNVARFDRRAVNGGEKHGDL